MPGDRPVQQDLLGGSSLWVEKGLRPLNKSWDFRGANHVRKVIQYRSHLPVQTATFLLESWPVVVEIGH